MRGWPALTWLLRTFGRPYTGQIGFVILLLAVQAAGTLYLPDVNADIINDGVITGDVHYIWRAGGVMVGVAVILGVLAVLTVHRASRVSMAAGADLRTAIYQRVQGFSVAEVNRFGVPSLVTRTVNDVQQVQLFLQMTLTTLVLAVIISAGAMVMAIREGPALSLLLAVAIPVMVVVIAVMLAALIPTFRSVQGRLDRINQILREQVTGVRVIRAFGRGTAEQDRFRAENAGLTQVSRRANRIFALVMPVLLGIGNLSSVGVIWFGGRLAARGSMPIGNLTAFLIYILQVLLYAGIAVTVIILIPRAVASAERIVEVLGTVPGLADPAATVLPVSASGLVEFRDVSFGYPGSERPVLTDLTVTLQPGQTSAIIGGTGSGKTSLVNLIPRFSDVTRGSVLVHGLDVRLQATERLWSTIGLVPQSAFLFGGTVASNLRFGRPDATDEQLWRALDVAQAAGFVDSMPGQLEAKVDPGGRNLSGGQRQRLSIARALLRQPSLYLFDDCFSALDPATDARLREALRAEAGEAAVLIVTQRVSTVMHADQIIVLDAGRIAGIGTHERLLAGCEPYREIVASQLGQEEEAA